MNMTLSEQLVEVQELQKVYDAQDKLFKEGAGEQPTTSRSILEITEKMIRNMMGDYSHGRASIREAITTTDAVNLIPKVIEGKLREAAEPEYLATRFMSTVNVEGSNSAVYVIPVIGEIHASEVSEGGRYDERTPDLNTIENAALEIRVKKIGVKVGITDEAIQDSSWDILGINIRKMGQAMARYKEEWIFNSFSDHGHIVFDNARRAREAAAGTTGLGKDGNPNDTLSVEDFLDMVLGVMSNGFIPTDVIMHPLTWVVFARNSMIGNGLSWGALGGQGVSPYGTVQGKAGFAGMPNDGSGQKLIMKPGDVQGRLPMPLTMNFSPFIRFDKVNKKFDMYCLDRSNVGVIVNKESLSTEKWVEPERDIQFLKVKERYGVGILNNGRAITVARNIAVDVSYPETPIISVNHVTP